MNREKSLKQAPERYILVVEDSDEDFNSFERVLKKHCELATPIKRCYDGDEALDFLNRKGSYADIALTSLPSLMVLDLNLPGTDGREVLSYIKQDDVLKIIPVVVFTTSSNPKDVKSCYQFGANSYLLKQMNIQKLKTSVCHCLNYWMDISVLPDTSLGD
ncbi:MAG: response regulator [Cyanobacteria bacterium J06560_2]